MKSWTLMAAFMTAVLALSGAAQGADEAKARKIDKPNQAAGPGGDASGKWMLGCQAWTFHQDTLFEAIDNTHELGLKYIELIPWQRISREQKDVKCDPDASDATIAKIKEKLKAADVKAVSYSYMKLKPDEAEARKVFQFAKKMGIDTIVTEPDPESMKMVDKLAGEYGINVAIHNHPKPTRYWNPDTVLKAIEGCSKRIGVCADLGHWTRSGLNPIECLKKLDGRVLACHFKDLNEKSLNAHDVVWGTGVNDAKGLLAELRRQGFKGPIMIEYEYNWGKAMPEIKQCVEYFWKTVRELAVR